jgi:hypothetical protein
VANLADMEAYQKAVNDVVLQLRQKDLIVNDDKTKEMITDFTRKERITKSLPPLKINGLNVERVTSVKDLGYHLQQDFKPSLHVTKQLKKANSRLYLLYKMKRAGIPKICLLTFYEQAIRSLVEQSAPVFHYALTVKDTKALERVRKRAMRCIDGYTDRFEVPLSERREKLCQNFLEKLVRQKCDLIPSQQTNLKVSTRSLDFNLKPRYARTQRYSNSFIIAAINSFNQKKK